MDERIKLLVDSYGLLLLMEYADITEEFVVRLLVEEGMLDIEDYFEQLEEEME